MLRPAPSGNPAGVAAFSRGRKPTEPRHTTSLSSGIETTSSSSTSSCRRRYAAPDMLMRASPWAYALVVAHILGAKNKPQRRGGTEMERITKPGKHDNSISNRLRWSRRQQAYFSVPRSQCIRSYSVSWLPYFTHLAFSAPPRLCGSHPGARLVWYDEGLRPRLIALAPSGQTLRSMLDYVHYFVYKYVLFISRLTHEPFHGFQWPSAVAK